MSVPLDFVAVKAKLTLSSRIFVTRGQADLETDSSLSLARPDLRVLYQLVACVNSLAI